MAPRRIVGSGFSLLELLVALAVGFMLVTVIGQALLSELGQSGRFARLLRERAVTERALELMRIELQEALSVRVMPGAMTRSGCGLTGRTVLLHLDFTPDGVSPDRDVTYSIERKPDPIWRSQALMRCGPPYGLDGQMSQAAAGSSVWLDALDGGESAVEINNLDMLYVGLNREFFGIDGKMTRLQSVLSIPAPTSTDFFK